MHRTRFHVSLLLLVAFVGGGLVGPVLHRVQHAAEQAAATSEPCHIEAAHTAGVPVFASDAQAVQAPDCVLCATRLISKPHVPSITLAPGEVATSPASFVSTPATSSSVARVVIRGPPRLLLS